VVEDIREDVRVTHRPLSIPEEGKFRSIIRVSVTSLGKHDVIILSVRLF